MSPVDKKSKQIRPPPIEEAEEFPEAAQATLIGTSLQDLASTTAKDLRPVDEDELPPSLDGQETRIGVSVQPPPPPAKKPSMKLKRPTGQMAVGAARAQMAKPAPAPQPEPAPEPAELDDGNATRMLGAEELGVAEPAMAPKPSQAGAFSRQQAKEKPKASAEPVPEAGAAASVEAPAKGKRLVPVVALAVVALVVIGAGVLTRERLPVEQLQLLYPYGFEGARGPFGQVAPGAEDVTYSYLGGVDCESHERCMRFRYEAGAFSGTMVVGREPGGHWSRVNDDGLPFPVPVPGK